MIYTVTLNPAMDYFLEVDHPLHKGLNLPVHTHFAAGGKGLNVSVVVSNLGGQTIATGFLGGLTGLFVRDYLKNFGVVDSFVEIKDATRINVNLSAGGVESQIYGPPPRVEMLKLYELLAKLNNVTDNDFLILGGSVAAGIDKNIYNHIMEILPPGVRVVIDTRGEALGEALKNKPFLVKPNEEEVAEFFKKELKTTEEIISSAKEIQKLGAKNVIVSLGGKGSVFVCEDGNTYTGGVPKGKLVNTIGAGDSMIAGFVYALSVGTPYEEAYKYGIASGSATAYSVGLAEKSLVEQLYTEVEITKHS